MRKAWVLQEVESEKYFTTNLYIKDELWQKDIINVVFYGTHEEAELQANRFNKMAKEEFYKVVEIEINIIK